MVKVERSFPAPKSLAEEAKKRRGKYDLQDPNVEHLLPHKDGKYPERKFDWENLFWVCGHCNGIKNNQKFWAVVSDVPCGG